MNKNYEFLLKDISKKNNIGKKTATILKKKNINSIFDMLWRLPQSFTDRTNIYTQNVISTLDWLKNN